MQNKLSPEAFSKYIDERLKKRRFSLLLKRFVDIVLSLIGITILLIPFIIISVIIKLTSKGPVFYRQERIKKGDVPFRIFKFRTMVQDADKKGMLITVGEDKRITGIGKFLRKSKIDELPQLINVFIGDMSFVGPRPEVPKYTALYDEYQKNILKIRPGITDLASIKYKDEASVLAKSENPEETYINEIMQEKLRINLEYIEKISVIQDIKLIVITILEVIGFEINEQKD
ncbi:sugar transferase [Mediannikoviicoccus vaginalis]|uniref:sugar transferase n=1 Tax=Mediannikoviicoccus vaginalis TaxID=2899727 RepID=UPI001F2C9B9F|nr:sugar transferase [Mediannikoviicoccus vaginalis]